MTADIRKRPCQSCPYRKDVPSGVWHHDEYTKLRAYDAPTSEQPIGAFACHATPESLCAGWAQVHTSRGHEYDLLALRFIGVDDRDIPKPTTPLWASGNEAADHGQADIDAPPTEAVVMMDRLTRRYPRLREGAS